MIFPANISARTVEIFKTTVNKPSEARLVVEKLQHRFPYYRINFDLADCDRILRVEARLGRIDIETIREIVRACNHDIDLIL
jgi:predicted RNA-binding protein YlqC (UPF0109 family)